MRQKDIAATVFLDNPASIEDLEFAMKRLKKIVNDENILTELKKKEFYKKPSLVRREKKLAAQRRIYKKSREIFYDDEKN